MLPKQFCTVTARAWRFDKRKGLVSVNDCFSMLRYLSTGKVIDYRRVSEPMRYMLVPLSRIFRTELASYKIIAVVTHRLCKC